MAQIMKRLGINVKEIEDVEQVIIRTQAQDYIFDKPDVTLMDAQGIKTYQISGTPKVVKRKVEETIPQEDIELVANQTGKSKEEARKALEATKGDIAEAILKLTGERS